MKPVRPIVLVALLLASPAVSAEGIGRPKGAVDVPAEALPPNQALRDLEEREREERQRAESAYIEAQRGSVYFASGTVAAVDRAGHPVLDPATGKPIADGFCLIWRPRWVLDNPDVAIDNGRWLAGLSFRVDPKARQLTVYEVIVPNGVETPTGFRPEPGRARLRTRIVVPLSEQPDPRSGCSNEAWISVLGAGERYIPPVIPWGVVGNDPYNQKYREKQRQNCIANPQIYHNRC